MTKYFFKLLLSLTTGICGFSQPKGGVHEYLYCINDSFSLKVRAISSNYDYSFHHSIEDDITEYYGIAKYSYWFNNNFYISSILEKPSLHQRFFVLYDSLTVIQRKEHFQQNETTFYNWYGHLSKLQGDMFILKIGSKYFQDYYITHHIVHEIQDKTRMINIDSTNYYKIFTYEISSYYYLEKVDEKVYLYVRFCPQLGIISYNFCQNGFKMELEYIDNYPIDYYMKNNICVTPFCDIE